MSLREYGSSVVVGLGLLLLAAASGSGEVPAPPPGPAGGQDPYWPGLHSPRLITPQWIGEQGVEAAILLSIDDMRDPARYEAFCRPILDRLKQIDGRAPLSIFTCSVAPDDPQLQAWLKEGVSIEVHTIDHPCPLLAKGDLAQARKTVHDCIDLLANIPGMAPVAYRMPCCDSMNSVSPRFYAEILNVPTESGNFLQADSSVFNVFTPGDTELPRDLVGDGAGRFAKYLPKLRGFVNYIENYPYPYVIGGTCWQLPGVVPSDWEAQDRHGANNAETVADMKAAIDATVVKKGVFTLVFHPHGWIRNDQIIELIDHAVSRHGSRVKFLNMREVVGRLNANFLGGTPLRDPATGRPQGILVTDADGDGLMDAVRDGEARLAGIVKGTILEGARPGAMRLRDLDGDGTAELISGDPGFPGILRRDADGWRPLPFTLPYRTSLVTPDGRDAGLRFVDVNGDGRDDIVFSNHERYSVHLWVSMQAGWAVAGLSGNRGDFAPEQEIPMIVREDGSDNGAWFKDGRLFVQNEDTVRENTVVGQRDLARLATALTKPQDVLALQPTPADGALATMRTHDRFEVQLVAAEPLVADPVDIAWGADGRLWVVEMGDYPLGEDGMGKPGGRVRCLADTDGDGRYDKSTVFLDDLHYPSGVMPWRDGVLALAAPNLIYARDADGDGVCDTREVLYDGFRPGNPQHLANGLVWGLDNWIHIANGDSGGEVRSIRSGATANISGRDLRVRPDTGALDPQSGMTQFSRPRDDWGNWFGCNNSYPLWHYVLHDHYLRRNPHVPTPAPDVNITDPEVHPQVYPASTTIERFNDYHTANRITSACGAGIYRDRALGDDLYGNAFICEPVHNLVYRQVLTPDGYTFRARRPDEESQSEFLASTDNWFRPVTARTGPDGALYVVDMYRHVIEHPEWIPPEWEEKLDLRAGHDRGRIYRVVKRGVTPRPMPNVAAMDAGQLVEALESGNGELRDIVHQELLGRGAANEAAVTALGKLAVSGTRPASRVQALCVLDGLSALDDGQLGAALRDPSPHVRREAVRLSESRQELLPTLVEMAGREEAPPVLLQLAASLGAFASADAGKALADILRMHGDSHWMRAAVMSSAVAHGEALVAMLSGLDGAELLTLLPALQDVVTLAKAVSPDGLLPRLASATAGKLAAAGRDLAAQSFAVAGSFFSAGVRDGLEPVVVLAVECARDPQADAELRAGAAALLGQTGSAEHMATLASLLDFKTPPDVQAAALGSIAALGSAADAAALFARWEQFAPATRRALVAACIARPNWTPALLDAAQASAGIANSLTESDRDRLRNSSADAIRSRVDALFAASEASPAADQMERLKVAATLAGDRARGKELFTAQCSTCHRLEDTGRHVGPDLTALTDRSFDAMLTAIVDPNAAVEDKYVSYLVTTTGGENLLGSIATETGTSLTLQLTDGSERPVLRGEVQALAGTGKSLMPEGLGAALEPQDLADLVAFVQNARPPRREFAGNEPQTVTADDSGQLRLLATMAAIHGPTIRFSTRYRQLENWRNAQDEAVWSVVVPAAGTYKVEVDASVDSGVPDNRFQVVAPTATLTGDTPPTRSENDFRVRDCGTLQLEAGLQEIVFRPAAPIKSFLLDLRGVYLTPLQ